MAKSSRPGRGPLTERVLFHGWLTGADAATQVLVNLNPTNMNVAPATLTRVPNVADNYAHYRILALKFRLVPSDAANFIAVGYVGGVQDTPPSTLDQVMELIPSVAQGIGQTVPTNWVKVPRSELAGPLPWYKTILGGADATEESPGILVLVHTTLHVYRVELFIEYEFKVGVAPANTPVALALANELVAARRKAVLEAERARLLRVLSGGGATAGRPASGPAGPPLTDAAGVNTRP